MSSCIWHIINIHTMLFLFAIGCNVTVVQIFPVKNLCPPQSAVKENFILYLYFFWCVREKAFLYFNDTRPRFNGSTYLKYKNCAIGFRFIR